MWLLAIPKRDRFHSIENPLLTSNTSTSDVTAHYLLEEMNCNWFTPPLAKCTDWILRIGAKASRYVYQIYTLHQNNNKCMAMPPSSPTWMFCVISKVIYVTFSKWFTWTKVSIGNILLCITSWNDWLAWRLSALMDLTKHGEVNMTQLTTTRRTCKKLASTWLWMYGNYINSNRTEIEWNVPKWKELYSGKRRWNKPGNNEAKAAIHSEINTFLLLYSHLIVRVSLSSGAGVQCPLSERLTVVRHAERHFVKWTFRCCFLPFIYLIQRNRRL